jgi:hypothetical protein
MALPLIPCVWSGEAFEPRPAFRKIADAEYVIGECYVLEAQEQRSAASHRHYFAAIAEAWGNLPERLADEFPSPEHLRKKALVRAGYRDERTMVASSKAEALRLAAFVRPMDGYAVVSVSGSTVVVLTAKSQSLRAMGKEAFQASKDAVLEIVAGLVDVTPDALLRNAETVA